MGNTLKDLRLIPIGYELTNNKNNFGSNFFISNNLLSLLKRINNKNGTILSTQAEPVS